MRVFNGTVCRKNDGSVLQDEDANVMVSTK